jgi:hypothetical protein
MARRAAKCTFKERTQQIDKTFGEYVNNRVQELNKVKEKVESELKQIKE